MNEDIKIDPEALEMRNVFLAETHGVSADTDFGQMDKDQNFIWSCVLAELMQKMALAAMKGYQRSTREETLSPAIFARQAYQKAAGEQLCSSNIDDWDVKDRVVWLRVVSAWMISKYKK